MQPPLATNLLRDTLGRFGSRLWCRVIRVDAKYSENGLARNVENVPYARTFLWTDRRRYVGAMNRDPHDQ